MTSQEATLKEVDGSIFFITLVCMLASLMAVLDISIVNVALSDIRASLGVQLDQIAWVSTGYMMANVIVIPLTGWFQKKIGLKTYFILSLVIFIVASFLCGIAWNLQSLTLFRVLQGCGGGAIIPTASTILVARYPKEKQSMAQAFIGLGATTAPLLGPSLGGYLIHISTWHWIFLINIPFGIIAIILAFKFIETPHFQSSESPFDLKGFALLACGLGALQFVLEEGGRNDWFHDPKITVLSIVSFVSLVTLVFQQLESNHPMIEFEVFKNKNYVLCTLINFLFGLCLFSGSFLFSLFCGQVLNYEPLDIGILFLKGCFIQIIIMPLIGKFGHKFDARLLIAFGILMVCGSIYLNSILTQRTSDADLILVLFIRTLGLGFIFIPLSTTAIAKVSPPLMGNAIGIFSLTRELGGSIGLAWMSSNIVDYIKIYSQNMSEKLIYGKDTVHTQMNILKSFFQGKGLFSDFYVYNMLENRAHLQSIILAFSYTFSHLCVLFLCATTLVFLLDIEKPNEKIDVHFH